MVIRSLNYEVRTWSGAALPRASGCIGPKDELQEESTPVARVNLDADFASL